MACDNGFVTPGLGFIIPSPQAFRGRTWLISGRLPFIKREGEPLVQFNDGTVS
jgi:hypothetical protein